MNDLVGRRRHGKAAVIPIRATVGEESKTAADVSRRIGGITNTSTTAEIYARMDELSFELRCVEEAIGTLELLAAGRYPEQANQAKTQILHRCFKR